MALYPGSQFLTGLEGHHPARDDWNFFTGFGISPRAGALVPQVKIPETGQFDGVIGLQGAADFLEKILDQLLGFALVEAELIVEQLGNVGLGEGCHCFILPAIWHPTPSPKPRLRLPPPLVRPHPSECAPDPERSSSGRYFFQ